ncbi:hypothetical protein [Legionella cardiaca]|uniref:Cofactor-independent phosphoglycerate mutase n=1 Tax=Legionella cardiaca TaxID=1071983 RepID=A0ABY8AUF8_9GAMM|nr:hypothetical protein [Legionella cardiaca]WED44315.1 hypothetical protein PXX05_05885 [Legionella cardiaca]
MQIVVNDLTQPLSDSKPLFNHGSYYTNVLGCMGFDASNPPIADLLRIYYKLEGNWLVASPIHWEATHNDAMITATDSNLVLSEEESRLLFADVAEFLSLYNIDAFYHDPYTWLLKIDNKPTISSQSVYAMLHQSLMPALNKLDKELFWQRLITELQMFLSSHPLNIKRQHQLPINGLWFWGEGEFKPKSNKKLITDDEVLLGLIPKIAQISPLSSSFTFDKNSMIFIKYPQRIDISSLKEKTQKYTVHWYWNNLAYSKQPARWWSRLWRS